MNDIVCKCCGSGDTNSSLEKIGYLTDLIIIINCYSCKISFYETPTKKAQKKTPS